MTKIVILLITSLCMLTASEAITPKSPPFVNIQILGIDQASQTLNQTGQNFLTGIREITALLQNPNISEENREQISAILTDIQGTLERTNKLLSTMQHKTHNLKLPDAQFVSRVLHDANRSISTHVHTVKTEINAFENTIQTTIIWALGVLVLILALFIFLLAKKVNIITSHALSLVRSINKLTDLLEERL